MAGQIPEGGHRLSRLDFRTMLRRGVWCAALFGIAVVCFGWAWPVRTEVDGFLMHLLNYCAFAVRTVVLHALLAFLVLIKVALLLRMRVVLLPLLGVSAFLAWPAWLEIRPKSIPSMQGDTLTVYSANLLFGKSDPEILLEDIHRSNADMVLFQEYTFTAQDRLRDRIIADYPHAIEHPRENTTGKAIFSRLPFTRVSEPPARSRMITPGIFVGVELDGQEMLVKNIHLITPIHPRLIEHQSRQARELIGWADSEGRPFVLAGDFNCTPYSAHAAWLRRAGMIDAHRAVGRGYARTWSAIGLKRFITHVRIDHVYTGNGLVPVAHALGEPNGSDHRPLITTVGFPARVHPMP